MRDVCLSLSELENWPERSRARGTAPADVEEAAPAASEDITQRRQ